MADIYRVSLSLLDSPGGHVPMLTFNDMRVLELTSPLAGVDVLIGMDVLLTCRLLVDGPAHLFAIDF